MTDDQYIHPLRSDPAQVNAPDEISKADHEREIYDDIIIVDGVIYGNRSSPI